MWGLTEVVPPVILPKFFDAISLKQQNLQIGKMPYEPQNSFQTQYVNEGETARRTNKRQALEIYYQGDTEDSILQGWMRMRFINNCSQGTGLQPQVKCT